MAGRYLWPPTRREGRRRRRKGGYTTIACLSSLPFVFLLLLFPTFLSLSLSNITVSPGLFEAYLVALGFSTIFMVLIIDWAKREEKKEEEEERRRREADRQSRRRRWRLYRRIMLEPEDQQGPEREIPWEEAYRLPEWLLPLLQSPRPTPELQPSAEPSHPPPSPSTIPLRQPPVEKEEEREETVQKLEALRLKVRQLEERIEQLRLAAQAHHSPPPQEPSAPLGEENPAPTREDTTERTGRREATVTTKAEEREVKGAEGRRESDVETSAEVEAVKLLLEALESQRAAGQVTPSFYRRRRRRLLERLAKLEGKDSEPPARRKRRRRASRTARKEACRGT